MKKIDVMNLDRDAKIKMVKELSVKIYDKYLKATKDIEVSEWLRDEDTLYLESKSDITLDSILFNKLKLSNKRKIDGNILRMQYDEYIRQIKNYKEWTNQNGLLNDFEFSEPF